ncbi:thiol reductase thioredoxin [Pseudenhygromyxa sp. WMMC2535]|uniref:thioredoxin domain-containing protein n=1 Tax=Pseudenhygromyxa sp. WMMC2535 TaxID=2712867 RepID=UPI001555ED4E|nr:thioredoxin domain-containing protein [Pseudenhygromyxa sp. WMMC2535]NVB40076.1 thiol reductase thioredoxin [Pseudenhygromyxa sp. WMMC2535]
MAAFKVDPKGLRRPCPRCGKVNRVPFAKLDEPAKCGSCHAPMGEGADAPAEVLDEAAFRALIETSALPVLIDYWAPWCGPCRMVAPELETVAKRSAGRFLVAKVDTQALPRVGAQMGVRSIPTMAVYHRGRELERVAGARPAPAIESFVAQALKG